jgi:hypothetical protein
MILELKSGEDIRIEDGVFFEGDLVLKKSTSYQYKNNPAEIFASPCDLNKGDIAVFELFCGNSVFLHKIPKNEDQECKNG